MNEVQFVEDRVWVEALVNRLQDAVPVAGGPPPGCNVRFRLQRGRPFEEKPSGVDVWAYLSLGGPPEDSDVDAVVRTAWQIMFACESAHWRSLVSVVEAFVRLLEQENADYLWVPEQFTNDGKHLVGFMVERR